MKLFQNLFGKGSGIELAAPVAGKLVAISEVNDPTFGEEILGKGVAVIPSDNRICAPADGTVSTVFPTGHAAAITADSGAEILIHIGLDTVKLNGKHFTIHAKEGDKVKKGDLLLEADIEQIKAEGYDVITPMVICNSDEFSKFEMAASGDVSQGDVVLTIEK
ncbi:MAG: PTS glucose transporter subunit IIA [Lachnospiraceae bacterium]|mgnify:FL=1|nr:PTS glucose transporter subunit IIA [Lachnospiraceae bacterium]